MLAAHLFSWEQRKLGDTFDFLQNNTLSRADLVTENGAAKNVHYGDVLIKFGEYLDASSTALPYIPSQQIVDKFKGSLLQDGDMIMADTAEDEAVGKCTEIAGLQGFPTISGLHTIPLRPKEKFAPGYLGYYMNSGSYHDQLLPLMQGIKVTSVSKSAILNTDISYPADSDEQAEIGGFFIRLDNLITLHQRKYFRFQVHSQIAIFPLAFVWEQRKLSEYLDVSNEKNTEDVYTKQDVLSVSGDYGIVNQIKFQGRSFAGASVSNYGVVYTGDVVYTKSPLNSNPYGIIKTNKGKPGIVSTLYAVYHPKENVDPAFVQTYFEQHARMNNYMHPLVNKGAKNDMKVSSENALKGDVVFPDIAEQRQIVALFVKLDHLITLHQREQSFK